jgi:hypothetical protein
MPVGREGKHCVRSDVVLSENQAAKYLSRVQHSLEAPHSLRMPNTQSTHSCHFFIKKFLIGLKKERTLSQVRYYCTARMPEIVLMHMGKDDQLAG